MGNSAVQFFFNGTSFFVKLYYLAFFLSLYNVLRFYVTFYYCIMILCPLHNLLQFHTLLYTLLFILYNYYITSFAVLLPTDLTTDPGDISETQQITPPRNPHPPSTYSKLTQQTIKEIYTRNTNSP